MATRDKTALKRIHFVDSEKGRLTRDFTIDPEKIHEVRNESTSTKHHDPKTHTYRYVLAIGGQDREQAAHEFHDRVLLYPTKHGIFALYKSQVGAAHLMLGIPGLSNTKSIDDVNQQRIDDFKAHLDGRKMLVIRGAFTSKDEFVEALQNATRSHPGQYLFHPELPSLFVNTIITDTLSVSGVALEKIGKQAKRIAPNVPASKLVRLASDVAIRSGLELQDISSRIHDFSCTRNSPWLSR